MPLWAVHPRIPFDPTNIVKDYQLATYIYAFASFLDSLLSKNFSKEKLDRVTTKIEESLTCYRKFYTSYYDSIERSTHGAVDSALLGGIATAGKFLGSAITTTPLGDHALIDEALEGVGKGAEKLNASLSEHLLEKLHQAKIPDVATFIQSLDSINTLCNTSTQLLTDGSNLYLLPETGEQ